MPVYDYECEPCGPFTAMRPMAEYASPCDCPSCGTSVPRAFLNAPRLAGMDAGRRTAFAVNERSAHAPKQSGGHGANCGCCKPGKASRTAQAASGAKSFPSARPWMISH